MFVLLHLTTLILLVIHEGNSDENCDPETRYRCSSNNFCISRAKKCNGYRDCMDGEDEVDCGLEIHDYQRDRLTAFINGYTCKGICREGGRPCKSRKSCWLDDECGFSCIDKKAACKRPPPVVKHSIRFEIWKATPNRLQKIPPGSPTLYGYVASYVCEPGGRLEGLLPRCSGTKQWSNKVPVCVDNACRSPVPIVPNAISYSFSEPERYNEIYYSNTTLPLVGYVVRYSCGKNLHLVGDPPKCDSDLEWTQSTIKCVGNSEEYCDSETRYRCSSNNFCISRAKKCNGYWDCIDGEDEVDCEDKFPDNKRDILTSRKNGYICGKKCRRSGRSCRNRKNSCVLDDECGFSCINKNAACKQLPPVVEHSIRYEIWKATSDRLQKIPPGSPTLYGYVASYVCETGRRLEGILPRCSRTKQWSNNVPVCVDNACRSPVPIVPNAISYSFSEPERCNEIYYSNTTLPLVGYVVQYSCGENLHLVGDPPKCDSDLEWTQSTIKCVSGNIKEYCDYATKYRCSSNNFCISRAKKCNGYRDCMGGEDEANCAIFNKNKRDLLTAFINGYTCRGICQGGPPCKAPKKSCVLDDECGFSCINTNAVCEHPPPVVAHSIRYEIWNGNWHRLEKIRPGWPTLYGYVASYVCEPGRRLEGLLPRCSGTKQWSNNVPVCVAAWNVVQTDFEKCGQAGNVDNIDDQARLLLGRTINGEDSNPNAWPWQALITRYQNSPDKVLGDYYSLVGGGSIINKQWILTAAHVLHNSIWRFNWKNHFVISVGVFERPTNGAVLKSTIEMYSIDKYIEHEDFDSNTMVNDIALIKIGARYDSKMQKNNLNTEGLVFSYSIRPVCLPCKITCLTEEILLHGNVNLEGKEKAERCLAEEKILLENDAKVVATGFGHLDAYSKNRGILHLPRVLQQVVLKIEDSQTCRKGINDINVELRTRRQSTTMSYSEESNICCVSGNLDKVTDTCVGDSGGPVVREVRNQETGEASWIQIGIVSFGLGCGQKEFPSYYTNVARFIPWIDSKIIDPLS